MLLFCRLGIASLGNPLSDTFDPPFLRCQGLSLHAHVDVVSHNLLHFDTSPNLYLYFLLEISVLHATSSFDRLSFSSRITGLAHGSWFQMIGWCGFWWWYSFNRDVRCNCKEEDTEEISLDWWGRRRNSPIQLVVVDDVVMGWVGFLGQVHTYI